MQSRNVVKVLSGIRTDHDARRSFRFLSKPTGAVCNLDCSYCKDWFIATPEGEQILNYLRACHKRYFDHVDRPMRIVGEAGQGRAPAEIIQVDAAEGAARGRNDPCTCESGKKWKRWHGAF